jgi:hypothetical protein
MSWTCQFKGPERTTRSAAVVVLRWVIWLFVVAALAWWFIQLDSARKKPVSMPVETSRSTAKPIEIPDSVPGDLLLAGYADTATPPIDDLRKIHRVVTGYFSVIKDSSRFPIGGNADLAAALRGENPNREVFVKPTSAVFTSDGLLTDRWGSPLMVHPEGWKQLGIRSAGPDRVAYNDDDLVISPAGLQETPPSKNGLMPRDP